MSLFDVIRSWWSWNIVSECNHWRYIENDVTGKRKIVQKWLPKGFIPGPPDTLWADGFPLGETYRRMGNPPTSGSVVMYPNR